MSAIATNKYLYLLCLSHGYPTQTFNITAEEISTLESEGYIDSSDYSNKGILITKKGKDIVKKHSLYKSNLFKKVDDYDQLVNLPSDALLAMFTVIIKNNLLLKVNDKMLVRRLVSNILNNPKLYNMLGETLINKLNEKTNQSIEYFKKRSNSKDLY